MPSSGPRSQCALGVKSNWGGWPQRRTSTLSSALLPTGTDSCGMFGTPASNGPELFVQLFGFFVQRGSAVAHVAHFLLRSAVSTPCFAACRFPRFGIALRLELFGFGERGAPLGIELAELLDIQLKPARGQTLGDGVEIGPEEMTRSCMECLVALIRVHVALEDNLVVSLRSEPKAGPPACRCSRRAAGSAGCCDTAPARARSSRTCG